MPQIPPLIPPVDPSRDAALAALFRETESGPSPLLLLGLVVLAVAGWRVVRTLRRT